MKGISARPINSASVKSHLGNPDRFLHLEQFSGLTLFLVADSLDKLLRIGPSSDDLGELREIVDCNCNFRYKFCLFEIFLKLFSTLQLAEGGNLKMHSFHM